MADGKFWLRKSEWGSRGKEVRKSKKEGYLGVNEAVRRRNREIKQMYRGGIR